MEDKTALLKTFKNDKLIDIIKNYRQYGYGKKLRKTALSILTERGISIKDLRQSGNLANQNFNSAEGLIKGYNKNSKLALIFYIAVLVLYVLVPAFEYLSPVLSRIVLVLTIVCLILFLIFFLTAFQNQADFYRITDKKMNPFEVLVFVLVGIPFYVFMYFYNKHKLKEELEIIKW